MVVHGDAYAYACNTHVGIIGVLCCQLAFGVGDLVTQLDIELMLLYICLYVCLNIQSKCLHIYIQNTYRADF